MRVELEIFTVRPFGQSLRYARSCLEISDSAADPDEAVTGFVDSLIGRPVSEGEVLTHSTSWRHTQPPAVTVTYICYSEAFRPNDEWHSIRVAEVDARNGKTLSGESEEADVLAHGLRHFAFLIKNGVLCADDGPACESAVETLSPLSAEVAGRL